MKPKRFALLFGGGGAANLGGYGLLVFLGEDFFVQPHGSVLGIEWLLEDICLSHVSPLFPKVS
jgi:hypothetical protein